MAELNGKTFNLSNAKEREAYWNEYAKSKLVGKKIKSVRYMTNKEMNALGWYNRALVIELEDGTLLFPSQDDEGNNAGALFGQERKDGKSEDLTFPVL
jgi:hypothetical protein